MRLQIRQLRTLLTVAGIAVVAACGSQDATDQTTDEPTAVPDDSAGAGSTAAGAPVVGSRWVVESVETASASLDAPATGEAFFQIDDDGQVIGSTGCNGFGGSAEVGEDSITFSPLIATKKGCSGELGELDSAMLGVLRGEVTAEVTGVGLTITNAEGATLTLTTADEPSPSAT